MTAVGVPQPDVQNGSALTSMPKTSFAPGARRRSDGQLVVEQRAAHDAHLAREHGVADGGVGVPHERLVAGLAVDVRGGDRRAELARARGQRRRAARARPP